MSCHISHIDKSTGIMPLAASSLKKQAMFPLTPRHPFGRPGGLCGSLETASEIPTVLWPLAASSVMYWAMFPLLWASWALSWAVFFPVDLQKDILGEKTAKKTDWTSPCSKGVLSKPIACPEPCDCVPVALNITVQLEKRSYSRCGSSDGHFGTKKSHTSNCFSQVCYKPKWREQVNQQASRVGHGETKLDWKICWDTKKEPTLETVLFALWLLSRVFWLNLSQNDCGNCFLVK